MAKEDPMTVDLATLDDDAFMESWTNLSDEAQAIRDRLVEYNQENQRRARKAQLARMADLTDEDLELLQEVRAEAIETEEAVGAPGEGE